MIDHQQTKNVKSSFRIKFFRGSFKDSEKDSFSAKIWTIKHYLKDIF